MELKEYFRMLSESVEEIMSWLFSNINKPVKALKPYVWNIHINASMVINEGKSYEIRPKLSW